MLFSKHHVAIKKDYFSLWAVEGNERQGQNATPFSADPLSGVPKFDLKKKKVKKS